LGNIKIKFVQRVESRFQFQDLKKKLRVNNIKNVCLDFPSAQVQRSRMQNTITMLQRFVNHSAHVIQTVFGRIQQRVTLIRGIRTVVNNLCMEAIADFTHLSAQLFAREEKQKGRFSVFFFLQKLEN
jgi:hypothetical protein